jgi:two-component system LytT family response regulator
MDTRVRAVIAEDEELARASLRRLVSEVEWVELVGEAGNGHAAVETIDRVRPDLVFLDVMLPELTGLEVLQRIQHQPLVVFTTAYERFAVTAFELEALDYLVKPFGSRRFHETMERVRKRFAGTRSHDLPAGPLERLFARVGSRIVPVSVREVSHFQAEGDYVRAFVSGASHLLYVTLAQLEERLQLPFLRIHRSHMINVDSVQRVERHDERRYVVFLKDGSRIVASRSGTAALKRMMR